MKISDTVLIVTVCCCLLTVFHVTIIPAQKEIDRLKAEIAALQERCEKLKQMGDDVVNDRMFYEEKCEKAMEDNDLLKEFLHNNQTENAALRRELEEAREIIKGFLTKEVMST